MGICASCLGLNRRDNHDVSKTQDPRPSFHSTSNEQTNNRVDRSNVNLQSESSRLLDDDLYQSGYGYGALSQANQLNQPDPEYLKREREALDAICQRTSE